MTKNSLYLKVVLSYKNRHVVWFYEDQLSYNTFVILGFLGAKID